MLGCTSLLPGLEGKMSHAKDVSRSVGGISRLQRKPYQLQGIKAVKDLLTGLHKTLSACMSRFIAHMHVSVYK